MKILLAGDTHGNPYQIEYLYDMALSFNCDRIFQLGDFGYWEHMYGGPEFLQITSELAVNNNIPFYWLDGNHENHVKLQEYSTKVADDGMWEIRPDLFYSPRGNTFHWDGASFMTFGGAYSIDRNSRKVGRSFWFEEEIEQAQVDQAVEKGHVVNILLTHDMPDGVDINRAMSLSGRRFYNIPAAAKGRQALRTVVLSAKPTHIFHGHYHVHYKETVDFGYGPVRVEGLDCDGTEAESWTVIDTNDWRLTNEL